MYSHDITLIVITIFSSYFIQWLYMNFDRILQTIAVIIEEDNEPNEVRRGVRVVRIPQHVYRNIDRHVRRKSI